MEQKEQNKKILVVDDDKYNVDLLVFELTDAGYNIVTADNGRKAIELVEKEKPDLILLDVMMPEMSGIEVTKKLKQDDRFKNIPIILLTAKAEVKDKVEGLNAGADDYVTKPFEFDEIHARIKAHLRIIELEEKLLHAERIKVLFEMAGAASHEIAQPITGALANIELIFMENEDKPGETMVVKKDRLQRVYDAIKRASKILHKIQQIRKYKTKPYYEEIKIIDIDEAASEEGISDNG
jgi:DNA-binding response OmpR family regulator